MRVGNGCTDPTLATVGEHPPWWIRWFRSFCGRGLQHSGSHMVPSHSHRGNHRGRKLLLVRGISSPVTACLGISIGKGLRQVRKCRFLGAIAVGTVTGSLFSYFIWTRVTIGMQGFNPIFLAGFIVAAFVGLVAAATVEVSES